MAGLEKSYTSQTPKVVRIFVSSPADVREERAIAGKVIEALDQEMGSHLSVQKYLFEDQPMELSADYQSQIPGTGEFEIVITILWTKLGTPLASDERHRSGTQLELEEAIERSKGREWPKVLLYCKTKDPHWPNDKLLVERAQESEALKRYVAELTKDGDGRYKGALNRFGTLEEFQVSFKSDLRELLEEFDPRDKVRHLWQGCPYPGLVPYQAESAQVFYGRTTEIREVIDSLETRARSGSSFVAVSGVSGSGKSSLVRAGVVPLICKSLSLGAVEGQGTVGWKVVFCSPSDQGHDFVAGLCRSILGVPEFARAVPGQGKDEGKVLDWIEHIRELPERLGHFLFACLERMSKRDAGLGCRPDLKETTNLLVVLDQLEEVLHPKAEQHRRVFGAIVDDLARNQGARIWVLATVRSDLLHRIKDGGDGRLARLCLNGGTYDLARPSAAALLEIIRAPALDAGARFEKLGDDRLDEFLLEDALQHRDALPLLQFVLRRLWECDVDSLGQQSSSTRLELKFETYSSLGSSASDTAEETVVRESAASPMTLALAQHANEVLRKLKDSDPQAHAQTDHIMEQLVRFDVQTGAAVSSPATLSSIQALGPEAVRAIAALTSGRLLAPDSQSVRLSHETLLQHWGYLVKFVEHRKEYLAKLARVEDACQEWVRLKEVNAKGSADLLLTSGLPLEEGSSLIAHSAGRLDPELLEFVKLSISSERRRKGVKFGLQAAVGSLLVVAGLALHNMQQVNANRKGDNNARSISKTLDMDVIRVEDGIEKRHMLAGLQGGAQEPNYLQAWFGASFDAVPLFEMVHGGGAAVRLQLSGDRSQIAVNWDDFKMAVSRIAKGGACDGAVNWYESAVIGNQNVYRPVNHDAGPGARPHFQHWQMGGRGVMDTRVAEGLERGLGELSDPTYCYAPDFEFAAAWGLTGIPRVFDTNSGRVIPGLKKRMKELLIGHDEVVTVVHASFDDSGAHLLFDLDDGLLIYGPLEHPDDWTLVQMCADGASESGDEFTGVTDVAWSTSGVPLFIAHNSQQLAQLLDGQVATWRSFGPDKEEDSDRYEIQCVDFTDEWVAVGTDMDLGVVEIWSREEGSRIASAVAHMGEVNDVLVDPAGNWIASAGGDGAVRVWPILMSENPVAVVPIETQKKNNANQDSDMQYSSDGRWLVLCPWSETVEVWNVAGLGHDARVSKTQLNPEVEKGRYARFSPDSNWLAVSFEGPNDVSARFGLAIYQLVEGVFEEQTQLRLESGEEGQSEEPLRVEFESDSGRIWAIRGNDLLWLDLENPKSASWVKWQDQRLASEAAKLPSFLYICPSAKAYAAHFLTGEVQWWRIQPGEAPTFIKEQDVGRGTPAIRFAANGQSALLAPAGAPASIVTLQAGKPDLGLGVKPAIVDFGSGAPAGTAIMALSSTCQIAAIGLSNGDVRVFDLGSGKSHRRQYGSYDNHLGETIVELEFHSGGQWMASSDSAGKTLLWPLELGTAGSPPLPSVLRAGSGGTRAAFHPNRLLVATRASLSDLKIWSHDIEWVRNRVGIPPIRFEDGPSQ